MLKNDEEDENGMHGMKISALLTAGFILGAIAWTCILEWAFN